MICREVSKVREWFGLIIFNFLKEKILGVFLLFDNESNLFELSENHNFVVIFFHTFGKSVMTQNNKMIVPDIYFKKSVPTHDKIVVACTIIVTIMIDIERESMII